jgi:hypothetical protein
MVQQGATPSNTVSVDTTTMNKVKPAAGEEKSVDVHGNWILSFSS